MRPFPKNVGVLLVQHQRGHAPPIREACIEIPGTQSRSGAGALFANYRVKCQRKIGLDRQTNLTQTGHKAMRILVVTVAELPGTLSKEQKRVFLREMESFLHVDRLRVVLDCSEIRQLDKSVIQLLLTCLEEAMKHNGDIKLAAVSREMRESLEQMGVSHLFEIFDTVVDAVISFRKYRGTQVPPSQLPGYSEQGSESAA